MLRTFARSGMARSIKLESFGLPRSLSTSTCLLLTGIGAFGLGWLSSIFVPFPYGDSSSAHERPPSGNQDQEAYQESDFDPENQEIQENGSVSDINTPRSGYRRTSPRRTNTGLNFSSKSYVGAQFKQVILIRTDLEMVRLHAAPVAPLTYRLLHQHSASTGGWKDSCTVLSCSSGGCQEGLEVQISCLQSLGIACFCRLRIIPHARLILVTYMPPLLPAGL